MLKAIEKHADHRLVFNFHAALGHVYHMSVKMERSVHSFMKAVQLEDTCCSPGSAPRR